MMGFVLFFAGGRKLRICINVSVKLEIPNDQRFDYTQFEELKWKAVFIFHIALSAHFSGIFCQNVFKNHDDAALKTYESLG